MGGALMPAGDESGDVAMEGVGMSTQPHADAAMEGPLRSAASYSGMFGTDSNTGPGIAGMPKDFYIGKLGEGPGPMPPQPVPGYFNIASASATPSYHVAGYWFMYGPQRRGSLSAHQYGYNQGVAAVNAWSYNSYCCLRNVFADVEENYRGQYGWGGSSADNGDCVNGFLDAVASTQAVDCNGSRIRLVPGIYANLGANYWIFPPGWTASRPFVFWGTGSYGGQPSCPGSANNCAPCSAGCDTLGPVVSHWSAGVQQASLGGYRIVIWQFWVGGCGCGGDWDYSYQTASSVFVPMHV